MAKVTIQRPNSVSLYECTENSMVWVSTKH